MENESMANEDFRIIIKNDTTMKVFRDGRIFTLCKVTNQNGLSVLINHIKTDIFELRLLEKVIVFID